MSHGLPKDELYLYEDALRHGRSVVFALARDDAEADAARAALQQAGAESLDAARERWWLGIRDPEKEHYESAGGEFSESVERSYRKGFETALHPDWRGSPDADVALRSAKRGAEISDEEAFRRGYERGSAHAAQTRRAKRPQPVGGRTR